MEADAAVIMATAAGSSLSCFCFAADAAAITAAAELSGLFKAEVISSAFSDAQPFVFLCALFLFSVSDTPDLSHKRHCRPESASAFFHSISVTSCSAFSILYVADIFQVHTFRLKIQSHIL